MILYCAYIPPIFRLYSAYIKPIFRQYSAYMYMQFPYCRTNPHVRAERSIHHNSQKLRQAERSRWITQRDDFQIYRAL
jgi:hypothetical protein